MEIRDWLDRGAVAYKANAPSKRQALTLAADLGAKAFGGDAHKILDALAEREQEGSTGVGLGVAVPHARLNGLERMHAVFMRLDAPIDFESVDDQPVDLVFALFAPVDATSEHLRALARVSRLLRRADVREQLRQAHSADAIYALLVQEAQAA